jgi:hypothetical protein
MSRIFLFGGAGSGISSVAVADCALTSASDRGDQTWQVITTSSPWRWQLTTWLALLDHWQTLAAGVFALVAAGLALWAAREKDRREVKAMRLLLAVEIRRLVNVALLQAHEAFGRASSENATLLAEDVVKAISLGAPVVFPALVDRLGLMGVSPRSLRAHVLREPQPDRTRGADVRQSGWMRATGRPTRPNDTD